MTIISRIVGAIRENGPMTAEELASSLDLKVSSVIASIGSSMTREEPPVRAKWNDKTKFDLKPTNAEKQQARKLPGVVQSALDEVTAIERILSGAEARLNATIRAAAIEWLGEEYDDYALSWCMAWGCTGGLGICVYNLDDDPSQDDCLFCHEPRERK